MAPEWTRVNAPLETWLLGGFSRTSGWFHTRVHMDSTNWTQGVINNMKKEDMKLGEGRDGALGKSEGGNGGCIQSKYIIKMYELHKEWKLLLSQKYLYQWPSFEKLKQHIKMFWYQNRGFSLDGTLLICCCMWNIAWNYSNMAWDCCSLEWNLNCVGNVEDVYNSYRVQRCDY